MSDLGKDSLENAVDDGLTMELNGKTYEVKPFTLGDLAALRKHIKSQRLQEFIESSKNLPSEDRNKIILDLTIQPVPDELLNQETMSISGLSFLIKRSLKANNPGITEDEIDELITQQISKEGEDFLSIIQGLNGGEASENPPQLEEKS